MMGNLRRDAAPLTERTWKAIDEAVAQAARHVLAGRRVATFDGPRGWDHAATRLGTMKPRATREGKATVCVEEMALLAEVPRGERRAGSRAGGGSDRVLRRAGGSRPPDLQRVSHGDHAGLGETWSSGHRCPARRGAARFARHRRPLRARPGAGAVLHVPPGHRGRGRIPDLPPPPRRSAAFIAPTSSAMPAPSSRRAGMTSSLRLVATSPSAIAVTTPRAFTCSASRPSLLSS